MSGDEPERCRTHQLKTHVGPFAATLAGLKRAEIRVNDRGYHVGDWLMLLEWDPEISAETGRKLLTAVQHITRSGPAPLPAGVVVLHHGEVTAYDL